MASSAKTVSAYLASLPADRRAAISAVRDVIRANLDAGYEEGIQYGVIGYYVPHRLFPAGYHADPKQPLPFAALASKKAHMSLYMMGVYCGCAEGEVGETSDAKWFRQAWAKTGKKLDMGKACVRFKRLDQLPLEVVGEAIRRIPAKLYVERYLQVLADAGRQREARAAKKRASGRPGRAPARQARTPARRDRGPGA
jgi:hypothetical protein